MSTFNFDIQDKINLQFFGGYSPVKVVLRQEKIVFNIAMDLKYIFRRILKNYIN